jgi:hypothetical protein
MRFLEERERVDEVASLRVRLAELRGELPEEEETAAKIA